MKKLPISCSWTYRKIPKISPSKGPFKNISPARGLFSEVYGKSMSRILVTSLWVALTYFNEYDEYGSMSMICGTVLYTGVY